MNKILSEIIAYKKQFVAEQQSLYPIKLLEKSLYFETSTVSLKHYIKHKIPNGIIAEFKRKSPSQSWINQYADIETISVGSMQAGASALSILTDEVFFGAKDSDLVKARSLNYCPILRKEFIVDAYQIYEAKSKGADAILLIAKVLDKGQMREFSNLAHQLGLEVLIEIHEKFELDKFQDTTFDLVGINNRNLDDFSIDFENSIHLIEQLPPESIKIAESGIHNPNDISNLRKAGFDGFLIGTQFMKHSQPHQALSNFISEIAN